MSINGWLVVLVSISLSLLFLCVYTLLGRKQKHRYETKGMMEDFFPSHKRKLALRNFYLRAYVLCLRFPGLHGYTLKIRRRLETIHAYDEYTMRKQTMKIVFLTLGITWSIVVVLAVVTQDIVFMLWVILGALIMNGLLIDLFINRLEDRLLRHFVHYLGDVRHEYQQHRMVDEAIYDAAQAASYEAQMHAERIHDMLTAKNPAAKLERYYDVAPNQYLKAFAGISHLVMEHGDRMIAKGSMYLNAVSKLVQEMNFDLLRREKLNYLLKGLTGVAIAPIFFTVPLENWARTYFPAIQQFYDSKLGIVMKIMVYAVIVVAYVLIRKMLENDEGHYIAKAPGVIWEKKLYGWRPIRALIEKLVPGAHTREHFSLVLLLKQANSRLTLEWLTLRRIVFGTLLFAATVIFSFYLHIYSSYQLLHTPYSSSLLFGAMNGEDMEKAQQITDFDRKVIEAVKQEKEHSRDMIVHKIGELAYSPMDTVALNIAASRIGDKFETLEQEYYKWWELLLAIAVGVVGYSVPIWVLQFQRRLRAMDMQNEVDQFHAIILILSEFERMSVEQILEWMERFAIIFRPSLQSCLLHYDSGATASLEQLKEDSPFVPFVRIVERLLNAVEKIPIKEAFDDLELEQEYYKEKKKEHHERVISQKVSWGNMIGFAPMYVLVFLYLVLPLLYMSVMQMDDFVNQIQKV
ncbi:hypothetical protein MH117_17270 [Paenibacillus sp. ACRRX]|uniref:hypothetical protein n=1 Tax=Paenibacillus sp. ACRRX TaxID=2918206 RepID=UPI001EF3EF89|nr:hypothetical protein [Paenibacillus sp. ACRRX]MCG7409170.1 hypothetical protein [Paenibacillus sp. ACRRX]